MDHEVIDKEGRRAIDLESGGNGYLIQKGKVKTVEWENSDGRIVPTKNGEEIGLVKGQTWINIIPTSSGLDNSVTIDRKSTRLNSSHVAISYAVFCLKKK